MRELAATQIKVTLGTFKSLPRSQSFSLPFSKKKALQTIQDGRTGYRLDDLSRKLKTVDHCSSAVADSDLQIKRGGGHPDPAIKGGPVFKKKRFWPFGPQFGPKIREWGGPPCAPPLDPPLQRLQLLIYDCTSPFSYS